MRRHSLQHTYSTSSFPSLPEQRKKKHPKNPLPASSKGSHHRPLSVHVNTHPPNSLWPSLSLYIFTGRSSAILEITGSRDTLALSLSSVSRKFEVLLFFSLPAYTCGDWLFDLARERQGGGHLSKSQNTRARGSQAIVRSYIYTLYCGIAT